MKVIKLKSNNSELDDLKNLLLGSEIEKLQKLEENIELLRLESFDNESIINHISPNLNKILIKGFEHNDKETLRLLSKYIAQIIQKSSKDSPNELTLALQSTISVAISKEISKNKDVMVDTLYPIIGGMISKYVSQSIKELTQSINKKIEKGLSFGTYKRKIKSKITGVSETELLLKESNDAIVSSLFIIQKNSGLLIAESYIKDKRVNDPHMVASMASAIKDFINNWVKDNKSDGEIQILSYGDATLYMDSAGSVYIIAFLNSEPSYEQRSNINTFFATLVSDYSLFFQDFDGDDSSREVKILSDKMYKYLNEQYFSSGEDKIAKIGGATKFIFLLFGICIAIYGGYIFNGWYTKYNMEKLVYNKLNEHIDISIKGDDIFLNGYVATIDSLEKIEILVKGSSDANIINHLNIPMNKVINIINTKSSNTKLPFKDFDLFDNKLELQKIYFEESIEKLKHTILDINKSLKYEKSKYLDMKKDFDSKLLNERSKINSIINMPSEIKNKLDKEFKDNIFYNTGSGALDFGKLSLFQAGKIVNKKGSTIKLKVFFEKYISLLNPYIEYIESIVIVGHTDSSGDEDKNIMLGMKRADLIKEFLLNEDNIKDYKISSLIVIESMGSKEIIISKGIENSDLSRRIQVKYILKDDKILNKIKKMIK